MEKELGVYIHIPFCASKCAYCDFYSVACANDLMPSYREALKSHIRESSKQLSGYMIDTVYFGGGTPSFFGADNIIDVFSALKKYCRVLIDGEVTVEVNPDSVTLSDLQLMRKAGINRLSIGVQSANDGTLKSIGRRHSFAQAEETVRSARAAGFENVSIDLIYGLPSQTREDWADTLSKGIALKPDHISCYGLKIEEGTPLYIYKDSPFIPDDDMQADMYLYAVDTLARAGLYQYEVSNFAKRGMHSRHNLKYWQGKEYMGFGAAAHSYIGGQRFNYVQDVKKYCENVASGDKLIDQCESITSFEQGMEYLMLGLRTTYGISEDEYRSIFPCSFEATKKLLDSYIIRGWAINKDGRWSFTPKGFLVSNSLIEGVLNTQTQARTLSASRSEAEFELADDQMSIFDKKSSDTPLFHGIS
ncbi:MAG: radical SAM family heme chaperone HemW [Oscillospiraceae bacterium]|nr:radical SAM family heme chaperone HemW [Oscillospiraceae bacterium]